MSKELEALDVIMTALAQNTLLAENDKGYILRMSKVKREREELCKIFDYDLIERALKCLEAIDNANSSEALEKLDKINDYLNDVYDYKEIKEEVRKDIDTIKQSLLKSQEQEKVLKWLCDFLFLEPKQIGDKYYIKYMNREEGNYILEEVSKEEFELLKRC